MLKTFDIFGAIEYTISHLEKARYSEKCYRSVRSKIQYIFIRMKRKNILILVFLAVANAVISQTAIPTDAASAGKEFLKAIEEENAGALRSLIGSDFVLLSFDGQSVDGGTLLEAVSGGYVVIDSGNTYSNYTRHYQDTGVITGIWNVKGSIEGQSFNNRLAYTLVVVKQGGAWKVVSVQLTPS